VNIKYPDTRKDDVIDDYHGVKVEDPYRWLEDIPKPKVQQWIDQQNNLTESILSSYPGRDIVSQRTKELLEHESISSLVIRESLDGIRLFYLYKHPDVNQPILCYQEGEDGERIELVNPLKMKPDGSIAIDQFFPSWDGQYVAYTVSDSGTEDSTLHIFDLLVNKELSEVIPRTRWARVAWNNENTGFYYTRHPLPGTVSEDQINYFKHVYYHQLNTNYEDDPKVFGDGRISTEVPSVVTNPKNDWILFIAWRYNSADIYVTRSAQNYELIPLIESESDISWANLSEDSIFLVTFVDAKNGKIIKFKLDDFSDAEKTPNGIVVIEEGEHAISGISTSGYLSIAILRNASSEIHVHDLESGSYIETIEFSSPVTVNSIATCPKTHKLYLSMSSYTHPDIIQTYAVGSDLESFFTPTVNLDSSNFKVEQVWYKSKDGTNVPMFLVSAKKTTPSKNTQVLIRGYGNAGMSYTPMFFPEYMIWLERGGILAIPSIRGGGEFGEEWHKKGSRAHKQNTFDDFIAAIEWLHSNGYGSPKTSAIMGRSAGGLLVGAVLVQRPDLYASVYCGVPLLDMVRYTEFTLAKIWMSEFGNPEIEEEFRWLYSYSPYHHIPEEFQNPAVLFYTALGDIRVDPSHAMKMAARIQRTVQKNGNPILLSIDRQAGHGVGLSTEKLVEIRTNQVIFHAKHTGLDLS